MTYNIPKLETVQTFVNNRMEKQIVVSSHNWVQYSNESEQPIILYKNMGKGHKQNVEIKSQIQNIFNIKMILFI